MVNDEHENSESEAGLTRGVLVILVVGLALGTVFNQLLHASGPKRGLAWIKQETKLASLEDTPAFATGDSTPQTATTPGGAATNPATTSGGGGTASAAPVAATPSAPAGTGHASTPGKTRPPAGHAPAPAPGATAPAPAATSPDAGSTPPAGAASTTPAPNVALPVIPETREPLEAQYATIKKFWDANAAVFVDARSPAEYAEAHIPGAVNLPFDDVFRDPDLAKKFDSGGKPIITYCGGGDCDLSRSLATSLIDGGHKRVLVFVDGIPGWKNGGNAVATGSSPGGPPR